MALRYSCFSKEQQMKFDALNEKQQKYVMFRAKGETKKNAYMMAGYSAEAKFATQNGSTMERTKGLNELIDAMSAKKKMSDALQEETKVSKKIDEKAQEAQENMEKLLEKVDMDSDVIDISEPDVGKLSQMEAQNVQFYRQIANGKIRSVTVTKTFDKDGKLKEKKVVETSDLGVRIQAQKEVCRILGMRDIIELSTRKVTDTINITIVDARKKDPQQIELGEDDYEDKGVVYNGNDE